MSVDFQFTKKSKNISSGKPQNSSKKDFSKGKKGIFYIKDKQDIHLPIYLDNDVEEYFSKIAISKGKDINSIINKVLKKEVELQKELSA